MSNDYEDLKRRVAVLEKELGEAKKALEAVKPPEPFKPEKPWVKTDWTEGMSMDPSAMKSMVDLVNPKDVKFDPNHWAKNRYPQPGGFGSPPKPVREPEVKRGPGWNDGVGLEGMIKSPERWSK